MPPDTYAYSIGFRIACGVLVDHSLTPADYDESPTPHDAPRPRARAPQSNASARAGWPPAENDHLTALMGAIVSQQLSTKAAATIFGRFVALFPDEEIPGAAAIARDRRRVYAAWA